MAVAAAVLLASCSGSPTIGTKTKFSEADYGVKASPRVAHGKRVPKGGGRAMVGKPYKVAGKRYVPRHDPNYSATGLASWYGPNFHGRKTANGEVFDMNDLTAAHPTLPLPSYVRVTNLHNQRSVVVRVNDRGPFARGRIIDVSATAASMLDFKRRGVAKVKVDYVGPAQMDGRDRRMLMASYSAPGVRPKTMIATRKRQPVMVAAASRQPAKPLAIAPKAPGQFDDQIGPLILRSGLISSYAETQRFTPAQEAAADLAAVRTLSPPQRPDTATIQLGVFGDPANVDRVRAAFGRLGVVSSTPIQREGRALHVVRLTVDGAGGAQAAIDAARTAGLTGAFVVSR
ncbi:septal ring lytic transglycosylase RlpA family protein [Bauldia sp.]|uniref:septal ring lytic transglycosylase RlpA family protein n=1 Tax=Bauldia sp. TaxID=2575872 RepID=UPI003BAB5BB3